MKKTRKSGALDVTKEPNVEDLRIGDIYDIEKFYKQAVVLGVAGDSEEDREFFTKRLESWLFGLHPLLLSMESFVFQQARMAEPQGCIVDEKGNIVVDMDDLVKLCTLLTGIDELNMLVRGAFHSRKGCMMPVADDSDSDESNTHVVNAAGSS